MVTMLIRIVVTAINNGCDRDGEDDGDVDYDVGRDDEDITDDLLKRDLTVFMDNMDEMDTCFAVSKSSLITAV